MTPQKAAEYLSDALADKISRESVIAWIKSNELDAVDIRRKGAAHARYSVTVEACQAFIGEKRIRQTVEHYRKQRVQAPRRLNPRVAC